MKIKFIADYRGVLTKEQYYTAGTVVDFSNSVAQDLIEYGRAVKVVEVEIPQTKDEPQFKKKFWQREDGTLKAEVIIEIDATDTAKKLAKKEGIDLMEVKGSGKHGRIVYKDIAALVDQ